ncbi:MAG: BamA/TamA family outer membrane protein [Bacteroidia bacterium]|nr:BamA/TamA family outer membrane protein [Bacteroidia bacterium]
MKQDERLLTKNTIINKGTKLEKSDIESYVKQKPNRKILKVFRFHLWLHNMVKEDKVREKRILFDKRKEQKNIKRKAKGKKPKTGSRQLLGEWLMNIGEAPVVYDSVLMNRSSVQIKSYLNSKGYFVSSVSDSVYYKRRKKAKVYYTINASAPYTINKVDYKINDNLVQYYVYADSSNSLIKKGNNYDEDVFQKERERITTELNNNGYYFFTKDYVYYVADTNIGNRKVNLTLGIKNNLKRFSAESDSLVEVPHLRYYINNVYIQPDFVSKVQDGKTKDTTAVDDYRFLHHSKLKYKTKVLLNATFVRKGELYQLKNVEDTYKRLSELKAFKSIAVSFVQARGEYLDCYIQMSPIFKQSYTIETEGTNTSGNLGISGSLVYQNRNLLKGAEVLEVRLKGNIEAQRVNNQNSNQLSDLSNSNQQFNTVEIIPELNLYVPRFIVPFKVNASKRSNPKTIFTSSYSFQRRPDFTRNISNLSFAYSWRETTTKRHVISPFVANLVRVELSDQFKQRLFNDIRDLYIINSYSNHVATSTRYTYTYNEQELKKIKNFKFLRINAESSGNIMRGAFDLINNIAPNTFEMDTLGRYNLFEIPFSQYLRIDGDYRFYYNPNEINKVVFRIYAGIGKPLKNFPSLPFERSFFSGGANGMRAWQSRSLGPGSYSDNGEFLFDQLGDGQLEANLEYRFKLLKIIHGALFIDAGNVWLKEPNAARPGGDFQFDRFYKEIAVGSGMGIRADFNFFILRFDLGLKVRDPQFAEDKRWVIENIFDNEWKEQYRINHTGRNYSFFAFNIGIGYPF